MQGFSLNSALNMQGDCEERGRETNFLFTEELHIVKNNLQHNFCQH